MTVAISFGNGGTRSVKVFLQRDASEDRLALQPRQFSQEASLGDEAAFDLDLELFSGRDDSYRLEVLGLPPEIHRYFSDPSSGARLRSVRFAEAAESRQARLTLTLPDRAHPNVPLEQPIEFYVVATPEARRQELPTVGPDTGSQLDALGFGWARLELVARGLGDLRVVVPQLFHRLEAGEEAVVDLELRNEGSAPLRDLEIELDLPLGWQREIEPALIPELGVGAESRARLTLRPPGRHRRRPLRGAPAHPRAL